MSSEGASSVSDEPLIQAFGRAVADDLILLAALHRHEVDREMLGWLRAEQFPAGLGFSLSSETAREACQAMNAAMQQVPASIDEALLDELAADFANIFLLHGYRASPYESVWLDEEQLERQQPMFDIAETYRRYDLTVADRRLMPEDHIGLQLEFIGFLCQRADTAADFEPAARFMDEHLLLWIDDFASRVASRCATPFYAGLSVLTQAYCQELRDVLTRVCGRARPTPEEQEKSVATKTSACNRQVASAPTAYLPGVEPSW